MHFLYKTFVETCWWHPFVTYVTDLTLEDTFVNLWWKSQVGGFCDAICDTNDTCPIDSGSQWPYFCQPTSLSTQWTKWHSEITFCWSTEFNWFPVQVFYSNVNNAGLVDNYLFDLVVSDLTGHTQKAVFGWQLGQS